MQSLKKCDSQGYRPRDVWKDDFYVYFQGNSRCIFINKSRGIKKRALEPKTEHHAVLQPFYCFFPSVTLAELDSFRDRYFLRKDILRILDGSVVAKSECETVMEDIKMKVMGTVSNNPNVKVEEIESFLLMV